MILTWLLPGSLARPLQKDQLNRRLEFLEAVIDDGENGLSLHESFQRHRYPNLRDTHIERFFFLAFTEGLALLPPLREFARAVRFEIEREREILIEVAPARATLTLLTFFPGVILIGAILAKIIHVDRRLFSPIPIALITFSVLLQVIGRRWSERIITGVRN